MRNIAKMMGANIRQSYLIAPTIDQKRLKNAPVPLIPIETDGAYFFEELREKLAGPSNIVRDEGFDACAHLLFKILHVHSKTGKAFVRTQHPLLIFVLSYQDGLIHGLQRILKMKKTGEYHSAVRVHQQVHTYEHIVQENQTHKDYWNAAYALGYQTALMFLILKAEDPKGPLPPLFTVPFNLSINSLSAALRHSKGSLPTAVAAEANRYLKHYPKSARLIPDHTPYL